MGIVFSPTNEIVVAYLSYILFSAISINLLPASFLI